MYDCKEERKISEDFHVDPNSVDIRAMLTGGDPGGTTPPVVNGAASATDRGGGDVPAWMTLPDVKLFDQIKMVSRDRWVS